MKRTSPFDPGYDPVTVESHLNQSAHLMASLKISMACWLVADEQATRRKIAAARAHNVPAVTGGGPFEVAAAQGQLEAYLDLCADLGIAMIECGEGFTTLSMRPADIIALAARRGHHALRHFAPGPPGGRQGLRLANRRAPATGQAQRRHLCRPHPRGPLRRTRRWPGPGP
jgi:phosphosulfolactate synthase (CoM biosynthesis protein A)